MHAPFNRPGPGSRRARQHANGRQPRTAVCSRGSRAAAPTAALQGGRWVLLSSTSTRPTGSRAASPIGALPGGLAALLCCTFDCPKGSRAGAPTAARQVGCAMLHLRTPMRPKDSPAGAPTAALPGGRSPLPCCMSNVPRAAVLQRPGPRVAGAHVRVGLPGGKGSGGGAQEWPGVGKGRGGWCGGRRQRRARLRAEALVQQARLQTVVMGAVGSRSSVCR